MILAIVIALSAAAAYVLWRISLCRHPYARCFWCRWGDSGRGRNAGSGTKRWGNCKHCGGSGTRLRWQAKEK